MSLSQPPLCPPSWRCPSGGLPRIITLVTHCCCHCHSENTHAKPLRTIGSWAMHVCVVVCLVAWARLCVVVCGLDPRQRVGERTGPGILLLSHSIVFIPYLPSEPVMKTAGRCIYKMHVVRPIPSCHLSRHCGRTPICAFWGRTVRRSSRRPCAVCVHMSHPCDAQCFRPDQRWTCDTAYGAMIVRAVGLCGHWWALAPSQDI